MGYERYPRGTNPQGDYYGRRETQDYGRDYGDGRSYSYSSARDYAASGESGRDGERGYGEYGQREYGNAGYGQRERGYGQQDQGRQDYTPRYGRQDQGRQGYTQAYGRQDRDRDYGQSLGYGQGSTEYHGSYASDGRRFEDVGNRRDWDDDNRRQQGGSYGRSYTGQGSYGAGDSYGQGRDRSADRDRSYGRQPQGYDYDDRGFLARAGDEVRSWFGDEDAERRREQDAQQDERYYAQARGDRDDDYRSWRSGQIASLDRDYHEYRSENRSKFENEFSSWRTNRQSQRDQLGSVNEHMDVVGSDGSHVGTVDKVRGDRILLTKNDSDADGRHHSIPSSWISKVDDKVTLTKSADEAKRQWRDEERNQAMFGYGDQSGQAGGERGMLNRSFSGTYADDDRTARATTTSASTTSATATGTGSGSSTTATNR